MKMIQKKHRNKTSAILNFMPQRLRDDEIAKGINSWNSKHTKDYVKYDGHDIEPDTVAYQNIALSL